MHLSRSLLLLGSLALLLLLPALPAEEAPVAFYMDEDASTEAPGALDVDRPPDASPHTAQVDSNPTGNSYVHVADWESSSLGFSINASGEWSGKVTVHSSHDINIKLQFSIVVADEVQGSFETATEMVNDGETLLEGSGTLAHTALPTAGFTLRVEAQWNLNVGQQPPGNATIELRYGSRASPDLEGGIILPVGHARATADGAANHDETGRKVTVYARVEDAFSNDYLPGGKAGYTMRMGPQGDPPWEGSCELVTSKGTWMQARFDWSYEGHTLPAGNNAYSVEVTFTDTLSDHEWSADFTVWVDIPAKPELEVDAGTTSRNVNPGKSYTYTLTVYNSGSGDDNVLLSTAATIDGWTAELGDDDFFLAAGDSKSVQLTITAPSSAGDGEEDNTVVTARAESDAGIHDSQVFSTTARIPDPDWSFRLDLLGSPDISIRDRGEVQFQVAVTNKGNQDASYTFSSVSNPSGAFTASFSPSMVSGLAPDEAQQVQVTLSVSPSYGGGTGTATISASLTGGGSGSESATVDIELVQSGLIDLRHSNLQLSAEQGGSVSHQFEVRNTNSEEPIRIYFASESLTDPAASSWLSFSDRDGQPVSAQSLILIPPGGTQTVTLRVSVPGSAATGHYTMEVWISNDQHARISEKRAFSVEAVTAAEETSSSLLLYGVAAVLFAGIAGGGYWYVSRDDEDYDDEEEEGDPDEPPAVAAAEGLPVASAEAPPVAAAEAAPPAAITAPVPEPAPVQPVAAALAVTPAPVAAQPVVAQPVAAEPVAVQPVVAAPVVAQPVEATPVEAVAVEPVAVQPVEATPVEAVAVQPVEAGAVEATPVVVKAQVVEDEDEMEFS
ncbi:MAG: hypothetical protein QF366_03085 [Candidatus Poseidoniia archaeon]|jgi:uncharacterized membrane protein|nr:hypothetical protein [Candidatus Poseidoniia archaeon]MDP6658769.1 hypothetical protein [Candidatus Poseidoniia archaeon]MDP6846605.1 hypothetical protein [Candidatus Poseidoniia archaeon]MDP7006874.1 hypothetical protein [Candidatus Poseidoniia archaeon]|tara:strand:- start:1108 stop:3633 length:2526 start_codon:yes stop_codon:yes gene_type:complete